jgi:hypothetical protein
MYGKDSLIFRMLTFHKSSIKTLSSLNKGMRPMKISLPDPGLRILSVSVRIRLFKEV